ncbi:MAG: acyl-[acyl-carrier-protein] thioesterase [Lachnospiraceae bacterium]|jgi:acyl-ACP thioesterase|nr:acyl-[acyl-carrier-protein] thioesterase [Lachnospiraceae bacterium]
MYQFETRIRYSEVDKNGRLTLPGMLNYFQDVCTFQSEDAGVGTLYLRRKGLAWVLNAWQIDILKTPVLCDAVQVATIPYDMKGFLGYRNFCMKDSRTGEVLAVANSIWTMMDLEKQRPCRVPEEIMQAYELSERLDMEYAKRKILLEGEGRKEGNIVVLAHHLDTNRHVNNGQYVQMAMDFLKPDTLVVRMRAEYKKSAVLSDVIVPVVYERKDILGIALNNSKEETFAIIEFHTTTGD